MNGRLMPGETSVQKRLTQWIARIMLALGEGGIGVLKLEIRDPGEGRKDHLREYVITPEKPANKLAQEVEHDAQEEADGTGNGPHSFHLHAFRDGENRHFIATSFIIVSESGLDLDGDSAGKTSMLAANQRHTEKLMQMNNAMLSAVVGGLGQIIAGQQAQIEHYNSLQLDMLRLSQSNTIDRAKLDYDLETRKTLLEVGKILALQFGPVVAEKLMKKLTTDEEKTPRQVPDQTVTIVPALPEAAPEPPETPVSVEVADAPRNGHAKKTKRERN